MGPLVASRTRPSVRDPRPGRAWAYGERLVTMPRPADDDMTPRFGDVAGPASAESVSTRHE